MTAHSSIDQNETAKERYGRTHLDLLVEDVIGRRSGELKEGEGESWYAGNVKVWLHIEKSFSLTSNNSLSPETSTLQPLQDQ